jgi:hypothetical protein
MCTVLLPLGVNPLAVNKYIYIYPQTAYITPAVNKYIYIYPQTAYITPAVNKYIYIYPQTAYITPAVNKCIYIYPQRAYITPAYIKHTRNIIKQIKILVLQNCVYHKIRSWSIHCEHHSVTELRVFWKVT